MPTATPSSRQASAGTVSHPAPVRSMAAHLLAVLSASADSGPWRRMTASASTRASAATTSAPNRTVWNVSTACRAAAGCSGDGMKTVACLAGTRGRNETAVETVMLAREVDVVGGRKALRGRGLSAVGLLRSRRRRPRRRRPARLSRPPINVDRSAAFVNQRSCARTARGRKQPASRATEKDASRSRAAGLALPSPPLGRRPQSVDKRFRGWPDSW